MKRAIVAVSITAAFLLGMFLTQIPVAFAASNTTPSSCPSSDTLKISWGVGGVPNGFNHLTANIPGSFTYYMEYQTLYPPTNPAGQLDWSHTVLDWYSHNANYTVWKMNVKPGLQWSDGTNVTATNIIDTMGPNFAFSPAYDFASNPANGLAAGQEVASEYAYNSSEAIYNLNVSDAHFLERISDPFFVGIFPTQVTSIGPNWTGVGMTTVGSGPFYIDNYSAGSTQAVLLRNPYYTPQPKVCEVIVNYPETTSDVPSELLSGASDLGLVNAQDVQSLLSHPGFQVALQQGHYETDVRYNVTWYPYNMTAFRQALVYGINQSAVLQIGFNNYGVTAYNAEGIVPPISPSYYAGQMNYSYNPQTALSLLEGIGFTYSGGVMHYPNGTAVTLNLFADTSDTADPVVANIMKTDLAQIGITVNVNTVGLGALIGGSYSNANNEQHSMLLFTGPGSDPGSAYIDGQPGYLANIIPFVAGSTWESPPYAQQLFQGNTTIVNENDNSTVITQADNNIQLINSQYVPLLMLAYPDEPWVYNNAAFSNWGVSGVSGLVVTSAQLNYTTLADVTPATGSSTSTTTSPSSTSTTTTTGSTTSSSTTQTSTVSSNSITSTSTSSTSSSKSSTGIAYPGIGLLIVLVTMMLLAVSFLIVRRRR